MKTASCLHCEKMYAAEEMVSRMQTNEDFYVCDNCNTKRVEDRFIKPDVVLFGDAGEWFSVQGFNTILRHIEEADCLLVLGTSLKVTPFSTFPQYRERGVPMIIINKGDTPYDHADGTYVIQDSIGKTLSEIDKHLNEGPKS